MYTLFLGDWEADKYNTYTMYIFLIATLLLNLVLLNMIIAIMGDTYDKV
jgi:hypothetical protein